MRLGDGTRDAITTSARKAKDEGHSKREKGSGRETSLKQSKKRDGRQPTRSPKNGD